MNTNANDLRQTTETIDFGMEVEAFLQSRIGRYLVARAEAEIADACDQLKHVAPDCPSPIRALQHQIHVAENIQYWLAEAVNAGFNAQREFVEQES